MWKMADLETRKLIFTATGTSPSQQTPPAINQIPCADLQALDQLWKQYSAGRFGFSVQRSIWLPLDRKFYSKTDAWAAFGDRVGWRVNNLLKRNYWKQHKELKFATDAPQGHLPHLGDKFGILTVEAFMKHLDLCESSTTLNEE